jgi:hypothetical protein
VICRASMPILVMVRETEGVRQMYIEPGKCVFIN